MKNLILNTDIRPFDGVLTATTAKGVEPVILETNAKNTGMPRIDLGDEESGNTERVRAILEQHEPAAFGLLVTRK